jgi:hypothetical protein
MTQIDQTEKSEIHDLSLEEIEQVSGGLRNFPVSASLTPSIPIPPPLSLSAFSEPPGRA